MAQHISKLDGYRVKLITNPEPQVVQAGKTILHGYFLTNKSTEYDALIFIFDLATAPTWDDEDYENLKIVIPLGKEGGSANLTGMDIIFDQGIAIRITTSDWEDDLSIFDVIANLFIK